MKLILMPRFGFPIVNIDSVTHNGQTFHNPWTFIDGKSYKYRVISSDDNSIPTVKAHVETDASQGTNGRDNNIIKALTEMGFTSIQTENYHTDLNDPLDPVPFALATRSVKKPDASEMEPEMHRIVVLAVGGDVDVAAMARAWFDEGRMLRESAQEIAQSVMAYVNDVWNPDEEFLHLWITGFSWGGTLASYTRDAINGYKLANTGKYDITTYTFGAFGDLCSDGHHLAYAQDPIATGLLDESDNQSVFTNLSEAGTVVQARIMSAFNELTNSRRFYSPRSYTAATELRNVLRNTKESADVLYDLFASILMRHYLGGSAGQDFRSMTAEEKRTSLQDVMDLDQAVRGHWDTMFARQILTVTSLPVFHALTREAQNAYLSAVEDVHFINALIPQVSSWEQLVYLNKNAFPLMLTTFNALGEPTKEESIAFAHHPEMYFAWLLGTSAETLLGKTEPTLYHAKLLPLPVNLEGTVLDEETRKPLANVKVTVTSNGVTQEHTTDEKGYWSTYVEPGDYQITFECKGYKAEKETVARGRFGSDPVTLETLMEPANLPIAEAAVGYVWYFGGGDGFVKEAKLKAEDKNATVPDVTLRDDYRNVIVECEGLEPFTIASYGDAAELVAADMGDGTYTYVLTFAGNAPVIKNQCVVLREVDGRLVPVLQVTHTGSGCGPVYGKTGIQNGYVDYNQLEGYDCDIPQYGIDSADAYFDEQEDGTYSLSLYVREADSSDGAWIPRTMVVTVYHMKDDQLVIVDQGVSYSYWPE